MARAPKPIRPLRRQERRYDKAIRKRVLRPLYNSMLGPFRRAEQLQGELIQEIDQRFNKFIQGPLQQTSTVLATAQITDLNAYHRKAMVASFRSALGVSINPLFIDGQINVLMMMAIKENVELIRSIPLQLQGDLIKHVTETIEKHGFNEQKLIKTLNNRFNVAGSRAKLIARDQTSKTIGALTKARHQQIGITEYVWITSNDERVRSSHASLNGSKQEWATPPPVSGHPGHSIQCRCVAQAVIEGVDF